MEDSTPEKQMSHVMRKPVFGVSDQVWHEQDSTTTEAWNFGLRKKRDHTI